MPSTDYLMASVSYVCLSSFAYSSYYFIGYSLASQTSLLTRICLTLNRVAISFWSMFSFV